MTAAASNPSYAVRGQKGPWRFAKGDFVKKFPLHCESHLGLALLHSQSFEMVGKFDFQPVQ